MDRRAFTLVEILIAILVLIVVILAASRLFGTASRVAGLSEAGNDVMRETAAIERQVRRDFERLSKDGFFAIRCVAVPNDVNLAGGGGLLDPTQPRDAWIRADQLVLFTQGVGSIQTLRRDAGTKRKGQSAAARIYYGHAFQAPEGPAAVEPPGADFVWAIDPVATPPILPWTRGMREFVRTRFQDDADDATEYATEPVGPVDVTQPPARRWLLGRHQLLLADDGGQATLYLGHNRAAPAIAHPTVRNGRVDAAAQQLNDIEQLMRLAPAPGGPVPRPWLDPAFTDAVGDGDQRSLVSAQMHYPRAERRAPGMHRVDHALTTHVIGSACSSFVVDWTYADGVGDAVDEQGTAYRGVRVDPSGAQPWFGLDLLGPVGESRGVVTYRDYAAAQPGGPAETIFADAIEGVAGLAGAGVVVYEAYFGYNRDAPLVSGVPGVDAGYTPWPTAIRITMTLHDPATRLASGRVVQLVIDLPPRGDRHAT